MIEMNRRNYSDKREKKRYRKVESMLYWASSVWKGLSLCVSMKLKLYWHMQWWENESERKDANLLQVIRLNCSTKGWQKVLQKHEMTVVCVNGKHFYSITSFISLIPVKSKTIHNSWMKQLKRFNYKTYSNVNQFHGRMCARAHTHTRSFDTIVFVRSSMHAIDRFFIHHHRHRHIVFGSRICAHHNLLNERQPTTLVCMLLCPPSFQCLWHAN